MSTITKKSVTLALVSSMVGAMLFMYPLGASGDTTIVVTGNTSAGENQPGWMFNRDITTATPFDFNTNEASIGTGSINILPIGANAADKFIAENFTNTPIANINSISYDFMIGAGGEEADKVHFYMNVYANFGESDDNKFYDCRYNIVPTVGSVAGFTTVTFDPTQAYPVTTRGGASASPHACPAIPADMDNLSPGSNMRVFAINVGDTSLNDVGLDGYLDKVVVNLDSNGVTTYDFEPFTATASITSPLNGSTKSGVVNFTAVYNDEDGNDGVQWAVRAGTCSAGTGTVYGNVDGKNTPFTWDGKDFSSTIDMTGNTPGTYCFVFNPTEDAGDPNLRITSQFTLEAVTPVNIAPVAVANNYSVDEDDVLSVVAPGVLGNDTDAESNPLTAVLVSGTSNGVLVLNANGSFTYTPNANFNGSDSFTYKANDGLLDSNTVTVSITVNPVDEPVQNPTNKDQCKNGGWEDFGFKNQGLCIQYANTGKDSR